MYDVPTHVRESSYCVHVVLIIIQELLLLFVNEMDKRRVLNESARGILVRYSGSYMCNTCCMMM